MDIQELVRAQRTYFDTGATRPYAFRLAQLKKLQQALRDNEQLLEQAMMQDSRKAPMEVYMCETGMVLEELRFHLKHLKGWMRERAVPTPLAQFPAKSFVSPEPYGVALIISPWNYPVQLLLTPLVGAISSGCTAVLKPSPYVPNVSKVTQRMIEDTFSDEYVAVVQGNREVNSALLEERWDLIFFTGSPALGRLVMGAAAKNLTPVVLELGGKSPCIVDKDADIKVAAKRIAWGKSLNAGQTCIAPDYLMIHEEIKDEFLKELEISFKELLGENPHKARHFVRIVSDKAFERLEGYLKDGQIAFGGHTDRGDRYFEPTVLDGVSPDAPVMREEIFGPIFPVQTFKEIDEVISFVTSREKPLALYYFGSRGDYVLRHTSSGGACINDTIMHIANENIPFGGVGNSGLGSYHHKRSFDAFTHYRAVVTTPTWLDLPFRYMPYKFFKAVKRLL